MNKALATSLFCGVAGAAPWLAGAPCRLPGILWVIAGLLVGAGLCTAIVSRGFQGVPRTLLVLSVVLGMFLVSWAVTGEPDFQTAFSREQFAIMRERMPGGFIVPPWSLRLVLAGGCLLAIPALAWLGRDPLIRNKVLKVVAWSGLVSALIAFGQRWIGLPILPWLMIEGETERWNAGFFHYSGIAACLNLAWPLMMFSNMDSFSNPAIRWLVRTGIVGVVGTVLVVSGSAAGLAVGIGLLVAGGLWHLLRWTRLAQPGVVCLAMMAVFLAAFVWQTRQIQSTHQRHPDGWSSALDTKALSSERDVAFREAASSRGDRLAASSAPGRPSLWIAGMRMAQDHVWRGPGPGTWPRFSPLYSNDSFVNTFFHALQFTHHDLLQTAGEWGVIPALLWTVLWGGALWRATVKADSSGPGLALALFGVSLHSLVDFPLQMPAIQIWAALLLGLAWGRRGEKTRIQEPVSGQESQINAESTRRQEPSRRRRRRTPDPA